MTTRMTIGDFSRTTRLSARTLRFYHRVGLLEPSEVDPGNGYRLYTVEQIRTAELIREFRALDMPVAVIREVLAVAEVAGRDALIRAHLARMEDELERTRAAVAALRGLLDASPAVEVVRRQVPATDVLLIAETIDLVDLGSWFDGATRELENVLVGTASRRVGPTGGLWSTQLFLEERGEAALFVPTGGVSTPPVTGRVRREWLPAVDLAVTVHRGTDETMARTYAALGEYVVRHEVGVDGPVRETYLQPPDAAGAVVTEIGWPIAA